MVGSSNLFSFYLRICLRHLLPLYCLFARWHLRFSYPIPNGPPGPKHIYPTPCGTGILMAIYWWILKPWSLEDEASKLKLLYMKDNFRNGRIMIMAKWKFVPTHLCTDCVALINFVQSHVASDKEPISASVISMTASYGNYSGIINPYFEELTSKVPVDAKPFNVLWK